MLAEICSKIVMPVGGGVQRCVGVDYKHDLQLAYFKTSSTGQIDVSGSSLQSGTKWSACARPNTVFWEQNSGECTVAVSRTQVSALLM